MGCTNSTRGRFLYILYFWVLILLSDIVIPQPLDLIQSGNLSSPILSFTSEPTLSPPKPPISFIPYLVQVPTYLLIFLVPICSSLLILSVRPFPIIMRLLTMWFLISRAPVSCVDSTSCPYDCSSPRTPYPLLPPNSDTRSRSAP